jgi:CheY-like chemotaxis protein
VARVLLVEDDPDVSEVLTLLLEDCGHHVVSAATVPDAIERCRPEPPALVMLDVSLPGPMDGLDLTRALRADPSTRDVAIVLVTARAHEGDVAAGLAAGADSYVIKPFRPDRLLSLVDSLLADRGLHQRGGDRDPDVDGRAPAR